MDLVEIRKKAKSKKPAERKTKTTKKASGKTPKAGEHAETRGREAVVADPAEIPGEDVSTEEALPMDDEKMSIHDEAEELPASLTSLDDVLVSQREEVKDEEEEQLQLLTFQLGAEEYALNIMDIKEIIRPKETTEVPKTPDYILGIFSLRGTIIPVFDVCLRLGLSSGERGPQNRIVVVKFQEHFFGLHVDSVVQVLDIPLSSIEPPPEILGGVEGEFLRGIGRVDERLIILLNLGRILKMDNGDSSGHLELPPG